MAHVAMNSREHGEPVRDRKRRGFPGIPFTEGTGGAKNRMKSANATTSLGNIGAGTFEVGFVFRRLVPEARGRRRTLPQDYVFFRSARCIAGGDFSRSAYAAAARDRAGLGCDRHAAARGAGSSFLSRLLWVLLLSAAVHLLRRASAVRAAAGRQSGRQRGKGGRSRADGAADSRAVAARAHHLTGRLGLLPRGTDGLVRKTRCRIRIRPGAQRPVALQDRQSAAPQAKQEHRRAGKAARVFTEFRYRTRKSWSRARRVVGKAEYLEKGENPRFVVTSVEAQAWPAQKLYERLYCARGERCEGTGAF